MATKQHRTAQRVNAEKNTTSVTSRATDSKSASIAFYLLLGVMGASIVFLLAYFLF